MLGNQINLLTSIIQRNQFQTKHGKLDAVNAHPRLDTSTRLEKL